MTRLGFHIWNVWWNPEATQIRYLMKKTLQIKKSCLKIFLGGVWIMWCNMQDFIDSPWPGIKLVPPAVEGQSPNHWATREFPWLLFVKERYIAKHSYLATFFLRNSIMASVSYIFNECHKHGKYKRLSIVPLVVLFLKPPHFHRVRTHILC